VITGPDLLDRSSALVAESSHVTTPVDKQSGKRGGSARHKYDNRYLGAIVGETAVAAGKTRPARAPAADGSPASGGEAMACAATGAVDDLDVYQVEITGWTGSAGC
jgi:hypothetical protein